MEILTVYDNYYKYFKYKDKAYTTNTKVKINQKYIDTHLYQGKKIWKHAVFSHKIINNEEIYCFFYAYKIGTHCESKQCCGYFLIPEKDIEFAIEKIDYAVPINVISQKKKTDCEVSEVMIGWALYAIVLFFSFIFTQWYLIWFWVSIYFFIWRNRKLWE